MVLERNTAPDQRSAAGNVVPARVILEKTVFAAGPAPT
jgi:hypothetical protein